MQSLQLTLSHSSLSLLSSHTAEQTVCFDCFSSSSTSLSLSHSLTHTHNTHNTHNTHTHTHLLTHFRKTQEAEKIKFNSFVRCSAGYVGCLEKIWEEDKKEIVSGLSNKPLSEIPIRIWHTPHQHLHGSLSSIQIMLSLILILTSIRISSKNSSNSKKKDHFTGSIRIKMRMCTEIYRAQHLTACWHSLRKTTGFSPTSLDRAKWLKTAHRSYKTMTQLKHDI